MSFLKSVRIFETINNGQTAVANKLRRLEHTYKDVQGQVEETYAEYTGKVEGTYTDLLVGIKEFCGIDLSAPEAAEKVQELQVAAQSHLDSMAEAVAGVDQAEATVASDEVDADIDAAVEASQS